ncbi:metallophosphoesterase family protein [uncultured Roseovarius sp.]|uniref:metallophosphoesterase family protein n=1 Tax=uncultured Roseovarius sp. TaxID=293344 RepID=UPI00263721B1|nr:metallophosphoesterase family protein [uncultured Roseovarius sp.]
MRMLDLGEIDGPMLIFGGPYSNLHATRALLDQGRRLGIDGKHMVCTGDVVAYCANPAETVQAIRDAGCAVLAGNCERQLASHALDCGCGFAENSTCDRLSAGWFKHADQSVDEAARRWMGTLPDLITFTHSGQRAAVLHGGLSDISRFLWPVSDMSEFQEEVSLIQEVAGRIDLVFSGHSGLTFCRRIGAVDWINAGAIGMPPNDGRPETRFVMLEGGSPTFHRLNYDHAAAQGAMRVAGLAQGYDDALASGYWPSEEVLPPVLRRAACANG